MKVTHSLVLVAVAILEMACEGDGRLWGYALSKRSGVRSGVLYPQLDRMMGEGWLEDHWEERTQDQKRPARRYYTLTDAGRNNLGAMVRAAAREQRFAGMSRQWGYA
ncbi:PadR family transcriptional regulator [Blastococcus sp. Marseille-P5729]|uniref:PadR family transcriptional regulator n=1 Tax=Blastococcus sp. Marseille-P5729 TaxID=2086582 RepID=UPI000D0EB931|nr:helix-turn-helix transcriptional regulator [Blastococcus sp. Marseille-P5729]